MKDALMESSKESTKRRSQRLLLQIGVTVRREAAKGAFTEETNTLVVNAHGALVALATPTQSGDTLLLANNATSEERPCRVVYLGPQTDGKAQVGLEFVEPAPNFWHISFPPTDWSAASSKRPQ
jgi:hypothetical protein